MDELCSQESGVLGWRSRLAKEGRGAKKMLAQGAGGLQIRGPGAKGVMECRLGGWRLLGESRASVGVWGDGDLGQGRRERQAVQAHQAMSCSPFSAGTAHSLNLTHTAS